jgi:hypothetical protein
MTILMMISMDHQDRTKRHGVSDVMMMMMITCYQFWKMTWEQQLKFVWTRVVQSCCQNWYNNVYVLMNF